MFCWSIETFVAQFRMVARTFVRAAVCLKRLFFILQKHLIRQSKHIVIPFYASLPRLSYV